MVHLACTMLIIEVEEINRKWEETKMAKLQGSQKQIAWAEKLQAEMLEKVSGNSEATNWIEAQTSSVFFIDRRWNTAQQLINEAMIDAQIRAAAPRINALRAARRAGMTDEEIALENTEEAEEWERFAVAGPTEEW